MNVSEFAANVFIAFYLFVVVAWTSPQGSPLRRLVRPFVKFVRWSGLWHSWEMFAPDPLSATRYLLAEITLRDGDTLLWHAPSVDDQPAWRAFRQMRHTKYQSTVFRKDHAFLRGPLVHYLLRKYDFADNPPVAVRLLCAYRPVSPDEGPAPKRDFLHQAFHQQRVYAGAGALS